MVKYRCRECKQFKSKNYFHVYEMLKASPIVLIAGSEGKIIPGLICDTCRNLKIEKDYKMTALGFAYVDKLGEPFDDFE